MIKYVFLFTVVCLAAGAAAYLSIVSLTKTAETVVLPNLESKDLVYVLETLTGMGLNTKLLGSEFSNTIKRNHVMAQDPPPGTLIKKGRDVMIRISKGRQEILLPDLRTLPLQQATLVLENLGLKVGTVSTTTSDTIVQEAVITQYPLPDTSVTKGSATTLLISSGRKPALYSMPDLFGLSITEAETILESISLDIQTITADTLGSLPEDHIIRQEPLSGSCVESGTKVLLVVNKPLQDQPGYHHKEGVSLFKYRLEPGFLKKNVRLETMMFGTKMVIDYDLAEPGQEIWLLVPYGISAEIDLFIDDQFVRAVSFTPWKKRDHQGE